MRDNKTYSGEKDLSQRKTGFFSSAEDWIRFGEKSKKILIFVKVKYELLYTRYVSYIIVIFF